MGHLTFTFWLSVWSIGLRKRQTNVRINISKMRWQWWIWVSLSVPLPQAYELLQCEFFWAEQRQMLQGWDGDGHKDVPGEGRRAEEDLWREASPRVVVCCSHQLVLVLATLVTVQGKQERCGGGRWTGRIFFHFISSLFFTDSSGKIISGSHTAWTTEVSAVTSPQSGLVHWWQFLGTTGDPTETCIGSSCFVLLPSLVSSGLQVLLKPLSRVLLCCGRTSHVYCSGRI